jgi:tRNA G18 (ribose-2'-O)-methylase SpoU
MSPLYRCPYPGCARVFERPAEDTGFEIRCPACDRPMTARPLRYEEEFRARQGDRPGGGGVPLDRLPFAVLVDNVRSLWNVGSMFRTADACAVSMLVLTGMTGCPPRREISKTALGAEDAVPWRYRADALEALAELREEGYDPVVLERTPRGVPLKKADWPEKVCLVVGNEVRGISSQVLEVCRRHVHIPMRGVKESLNVAVAFGIAAHHVAGILGGRAGKP